MKLFDEWFINHPRNSGNDKRFRNKEGMRMAFKAGMLAAADLVKPMYVADDYDAGKEGASDIIREEIDE